MVDPSIFEAGHLLIKPFTSDLGEIAKYVRGFCVAMLVITIMVWTFSSLASPVNFASAKRILNIAGWFTFCCFVFSYLSLCVETHIVEKERRKDKLEKLDRFQE